MTRTPATDLPSTSDPPTWVRAVVLAVLGLFVVSGAVGLEAWPLTGWHLFSTTREQSERSWQAYVVDPTGEETRVVWVELPTAYRHSDRLLSSLPFLPDDEAEAACEGYVDELRSEFPDLVEVRIYKVTDRFDDDGEHREELDRELRFTCSASQPAELAQ
jgi:hypothetical protein